MSYIRYPILGGGGVATYVNFAAFPASAPDGTLALALDTDILYAYNVGLASWIAIAGPGNVLSIGNFDAHAGVAKGLQILTDQLFAQSATATVPGMVNLTTQTFAGLKTFTSGILTPSIDSNSSSTLTIAQTTATRVDFLSGALSLDLNGVSETNTGPSLLINSDNPATFSAGQLMIASTDVSSGNNSSSIAILTGDSNQINTSVGSGGVVIETGSVNDGGSTAGSGNIDVRSGFAFGTGNTGPITIATGNSHNTGNTGQILLNTGSPLDSGTRGDIFLNCNNLNLNPDTATIAGNKQIKSVQDPTLAQDAATKNYVDIVASALAPLQAVYAATTTNLVGTYANGAAGVGATFTITATGTFTVDGTTPPINSRILIKDQSSGFQNGVYNLTATGSVGVSPVLTRSTDFNTAAKMNAGTLIPVINGTTNTLTSWLETSTITTVGTDALVFVEWTANPGSYLLKANNLSDVTSKSTSFNNLSPMTTLGDTIYGGASGTGTRLAGNTTATKNFLAQTGTGSVSAAPVWTTLSASDLPTITLTGDVTGAAAGGTIATTLATVNGNVGSFGSSTSIPSFTVNAKGLITAASGNAVIAPAGTLTGTTLASNVVNSSLTSVGTITTGTWNGTTIAIANGGTGQTSAANAFIALSPLTTAGDLIYETAAPAPARLPIGTTGQLLTVAGGLPVWQDPPDISDSEVWVRTANGYGSTNTFFRRFTTVAKNVGVDITYTDDVTNGAQFVINTTGRYAISYSDDFSTTNTDMGITINANGTTTIEAQPAANVLAIGSGKAAAFSANTAVTLVLTAGDVINACTQGTSASGVNLATFRITRVASINGSVASPSSIATLLASSGTRVTTTPTVLGQWRSELRNGGTMTYTDTNGNPTAQPTAADGIKLYGGVTFATGDSANSPSRYEIFIGLNKTVSPQYYSTTGRTGAVITTGLPLDGGHDIGLCPYYDPTTGVFSVNLFTQQGGTVTESFGRDQTSNLIATGYFDVYYF